nr:retrovirus-related Pol polyprotein from transposon TNT 1-94 [Tanacetum cinerariifolium]
MTETSHGSFVQAAIPKFDGHFDHWSMLMENFLRSKEYWGLVENESNNLDTMTIDELQSSLLVHEQRMRGHAEEEQALKVSYEDRAGRGRGEVHIEEVVVEEGEYNHSTRLLLSVITVTS